MSVSECQYQEAEDGVTGVPVFLSLVGEQELEAGVGLGLAVGV